MVDITGPGTKAETVQYVNDLLIVAERLLRCRLLVNRKCEDRTHEAV